MRAATYLTILVATSMAVASVAFAAAGTGRRLPAPADIPVLTTDRPLSLPASTGPPRTSLRGSATTGSQATLKPANGAAGGGTGSAAPARVIGSAARASGASSHEDKTGRGDKHRESDRRKPRGDSKKDKSHEGETEVVLPPVREDGHSD